MARPECFRVVISLALIVLGLSGCTDLGQRTAQANRDSVSRDGWGDVGNVTSSFYEIDVQRIRLPARSKRGAIASLESGLVYATQKGKIYFLPELKWWSGKSPVLLATVPFPAEHEALSGFTIADVSVYDIIARAESGGPDTDPSTYQLFVSHIDLDDAKRCMFLAVSRLSIVFTAGQPAPGSGGWDTVFRSQPCIALDELSEGSLIQSGGRMAIDNDSLYLTVGQFQLSDLRATPVSQNSALDYGKVHAINLSTLGSDIYTVGHRNPQGLYIDSLGMMWSTEHGPDGGDEVNLLVSGADYGFPAVTLGTEIGEFVWSHSHSQSQNSHAGYKAPVFAFTPSIGISQIIRIEHPAQFPVWQGDLLAGSLAGRSLYRLHLEGGRVLSTERLFLDERVRDLVVWRDGRIVALTDSNQLLLLSASGG